jgi:cytidylate kinase
MGMVITVSRQLGSGGSYIATAAAEALGYRYLDREILQRAAEAAGFPDEQMVEALARREKIPGYLDRMLDALGRMSAVPSVPSATLREGQAYVEIMDAMLTTEVVESQKRQHVAEGYQELVRNAILNFAETGKAVIVGRGGQVILRERRDALHVRVVASVSTRVRNLMARHEISEDEAAAQIRESDRDRARYLKRYHGVDWNDPQLYHLVLNTDYVAVPLGEHLIVEAARWLSSSVA